MKMQPPRSIPPPLRNLALFSAILLIAAAAVGWWLGGGKPGTPTASAETPSPPPVPTPPPPALVTARSKLPAAVRSWLNEIERETSPLARATAAARLAAQLTPDEWPVLLSHVGQFSPGAVRAVLEAAVVWRWAEADPAAAADWGLQHHSALAAAATAVWVRQDAATAQAWFEGLTPQQRRAGYLQVEFYAALAGLDPEACVAVMLAHQHDPGFNLGGAEQAIAKADPDQALALAAEFTDKGRRESLRRAVAVELGRRDPFAAVAWAEQQPDAHTMLPAVFQQSSRKPLAEMIPAFASLSPEQQKHVGEKSWVWWERGDPFATLQALQHPPDGLTPESFSYLLVRTVQVLMQHYDPADGVRHLATDWSGHADTWVGLAVSEWSSRNPDAARAWMEQLPAGAIQDKARRAYEKIMESKTQEVTMSDPVERLAKSLARMQTPLYGAGLLNPLDETGRHRLWQQISTLPEDQRTRAQANFITLQAGNDPAKAAAWLAGQPEAPQSAALASRLAAHWALDDAPAAARWVVSLPEGSPKTWALWNLARQWLRVDPAAARRWAAHQPAAARAIAESAFIDQRPTKP